LLVQLTLFLPGGGADYAPPQVTLLLAQPASLQYTYIPIATALKLPDEQLNGGFKLKSNAECGNGIALYFKKVLRFLIILFRY
jgi:hypothetical protein